MLIFLIKAGVALLLFGFTFHFATKKYLNPYKLYLIFGKKGSGKSTLLTKLALKYIKEGRPVFTTESIPGTYLIDAKTDIGEYEFPDRAVVLADEVGSVWDNRRFKSFTDAQRDWFKLQRHRHITVYLFSQTFDVDIKIRNLTDQMYLCKRYFRVFSVARRIDRSIVLNNSTADAPSSIDENLSFVPIWIPGAVKITFIPAWTKYFDSFHAPKLLDKDFKFIPQLDTLSTEKKRVCDIVREGGEFLVHVCGKRPKC